MERNIFNSIKIGLASPEMIRNWSYGEVKKPETINYRTLKAEPEGLFCERIFGPTKDWECNCQRHGSKRKFDKPYVCNKCGIEVTQKKVRRERMGHIELAAPVCHIWYSLKAPSRIAILLDIPQKKLEKLLYFQEYVILPCKQEDGTSTDGIFNVGSSTYKTRDIINETQYKELNSKYSIFGFRAGMGAEAIKELLSAINLDELSEQLKNELLSVSGQKKTKIIKRLEIVESLRRSNNRPEWMILDVIPVIPPDIRAMVQLDGGRFASSDLNDLYRRVINRNNRLKRLLELNAPEIIIRNEKRMLQEAVDALIDNGGSNKHSKPVTGPSNRPLKSLSEMLRGKQGRFRQNLLGKRVDYSGRSVIVVGPDLKIFQCGLPKEMALELFKPFVMKRLVELGKASNIKDAKKKVEKVSPEVWDALENVIKNHPVLLNRAPTLHRLSVQAFEPVLVEGKAIKLHPLVCKAFNADFDGDQMPVHVPLSAEAQAEARFLMLSANNLLKPVDGRAIAVPSQDMVLGSYYLTLDKAGEPGEGKMFRDFNEAMMAYQAGLLGIHAPIKVRVSKEIDGEMKSKIIDATLGRLIFNQQIPQDLGYVDRSNPDNEFDLEIMFVAGSKELGNIVDRCIKIHGFGVAAEVLDSIKAMGYKYSTRASISISVADMAIPPEKYTLIKKAEEQVDLISESFQIGELSDDERYNSVIKVWEKTTDDVVKALTSNLDRYNSIKMMSDSGARGSMTQMRQLAGMRGLMFGISGKAMEIPIKSNFREGLSMLEYFVAARGARKSLSDTALKTADSGYLTRRLVDVSQDVIIRENDCGATKGIWVSDILEDSKSDKVIEPLRDRLIGRYTVDPVIDPESGEIIIDSNEMISEDIANRIVKAGIRKVHIRTVLQCNARHGVCAHCYGADLATDKPVNIGEAVGIIAAQSIGEPGTQLTMRTFHTGGVAAANITQGLPRVEERFEARKPKQSAILAEADGIVEIVAKNDNKKQKIINIKSLDGSTVISTSPNIPFDTKTTVGDGEYVIKGQELTEGDKSPADILKVDGIDAVYDYIILEVQKVYRSQSININDKHIEVITRQMTRKVSVDDAGDTQLLPDTVVSYNELLNENEKIQARINAGEIGLRTAKSSPKLYGITKASLLTDSFLSAASFQETTKVLTDAAIKGKIDTLEGLKENVIIGKLIPAGTGMEIYRNINVECDEDHKFKGDEISEKIAVTDVKEKDEDIEDDEESDPTSILDSLDDLAAIASAVSDDDDDQDIDSED